MTLVATTIASDDRGAFGWCVQFQSPHFREDIIRAKGPPRFDSFLDDCQQFALKRAMVPLGAFLKPRHHMIGRIFYREVGRHGGSKIAPFWI
jgi:hypothetical protein